MADESVFATASGILSHGQTIVKLSVKLRPVLNFDSARYTLIHGHNVPQLGLVHLFQDQRRIGRQ
jgi:hypothetical protein